MSGPTAILPFQPATMSTAQLAAVSYLARYAGRTHTLYAYQLSQWFTWCETSGTDPLVGIQRAHVELYIRGLGDRPLMDSSVNTMMHAVRGYFRFAHIDGLISSDPAVYARLPKIHRDESRTQGLDRLERNSREFVDRPPRHSKKILLSPSPSPRPQPLVSRPARSLNLLLLGIIPIVRPTVIPAVSHAVSQGSLAMRSSARPTAAPGPPSFPPPRPRSVAAPRRGPRRSA